jgi:hypothetical protein
VAATSWSDSQARAEYEIFKIQRSDHCISPVPGQFRRMALAGSIQTRRALSERIKRCVKDRAADMRIVGSKGGIDWGEDSLDYPSSGFRLVLNTPFTLDPDCLHRRRNSMGHHEHFRILFRYSTKGVQPCAEVPAKEGSRSESWPDRNRNGFSRESLGSLGQEQTFQGQFLTSAIQLVCRRQQHANAHHQPQLSIQNLGRKY